MPIYLDLVDNGKLLKLEVVAPWSLNDLLQSFDIAEQYLEESRSTLNCLADVTKMGSIPAGILRARQSPFLSHPRSGYQVIVGAA